MLCTPKAKDELGGATALSARKTVNADPMHEDCRASRGQLGLTNAYRISPRLSQTRGRSLPGRLRVKAEGLLLRQEEQASPFLSGMLQQCLDRFQEFSYGTAEIAFGGKCTVPHTLTGASISHVPYMLKRYQARLFKGIDLVNADYSDFDGMKELDPPYEV